MSNALADGVIALYERHALRWDELRRRQPSVERSWLDRFCHGLPPGAEVLDLGCGAGVPIASELTDRGLVVTGVDASATMLALFHARLPAARTHEADMRRLQLGRSFDGVMAWDSFFHLTRADQRGMFAVFQAHAATRTRLLFTSGPADGEALGSLQGEPLYHASLSAAEYRSLLAQHGFRVLAHVAEDPSCGGRTIWLAQREA